MPWMLSKKEIKTTQLQVQCEKWVEESGVNKPR